METIGVIGFRKVVEDFAAVCETVKQELANPDIASGIKDEVAKLGNQMDSELDALGEKLKPLMEAEIEKAANADEAARENATTGEAAVADMESEGAPASNVIEMPAATDAQPDATGNDAPLTAGE